ncbi:MAG: RDD family protein [Thiolinea sp.]
MSYKYQQCPDCFELSTADHVSCPFCGAGLQQVNYHPWRRFLARAVDMAFILGSWALLLGITIIWFNPSAEEMEVFQRRALYFNHPLLSYSLLAIIYIFSEALMLALFGSTPGKKLYRIRLLFRGGGKPPFRVALMRTFMMWVAGMGFGVPLLNLYALYIARRRLVKTGMTLWDAGGGFTVRHDAWGVLYTLWVIFVSALAYILLVSLYSGGTG